MKDKVSVIIPIYNVEKYLNKCVDSVINQTYKNIEIILVNDGSPDNCLNICNEYKKKDKRVKVIDKVNGGLSDARNFGIKEATGNWLTFIDSDDYVSNDYIEYLLKIISKNNADIGVVLPQDIYDNEPVKELKIKEKVKCSSNIEALITMLYQKEFDTSAWGKIYKKELFDNIKFPYGKLYEDISTIYKAFLKANKVAYSNLKKYYYLQRKDSIMGQPFKEKDMDYIYQAEDMLNNIIKTENELLIKAAQCRYVNANFSILLKINITKLTKKYRNEILDNIAELRKKIFFDNNVRLKTRIAIILSYIIKLR